MPVWAIRCFRTERGRDLFCEAYNAQPARARAKFRAIINGLQDQPTIEGWSRANGFDRLTGKKYRRYSGLGKIQVRTGTEHRPLGFFGPGAATFTLLIWATERDGEFDPPGVLDRALERMLLVNSNAELSNDCDL